MPLGLCSETILLLELELDLEPVLELSAMFAILNWLGTIEIKMLTFPLLLGA